MLNERQADAASASLYSSGDGDLHRGRAYAAAKKWMRTIRTGAPPGAPHEN